MAAPNPDAYVHRATAYARRAVRDKKHRKHCAYVRHAAQRHLDDLKKARRKDWAYRFDKAQANAICAFAELLPHVKAFTGLIRLEDAQVFWLCSLFGWRKKADDTRRFSHAYIEVARKNAKSTIAGVISLYCQTCEGEVGPEIYIAATTGDQANKVFHPVRMMALKTPELCNAFGLKVWSKSITSEDGGYIQPVNSKASTQDGHNPHAVILDELHAHKDRALFDVMDSALGARRNPLLLMITTAGFNLDGVCYQLRVLYAKMLEGLVTLDHVFAIIYTLDEGDDPYNPKVWIKANPLIGVSVREDSIADKAREAQIDPGQEGNFKTKRCNIWLNASGAWLNAQQWLACADEGICLEDLADHITGIGVDLADKDDIAALVIEAVKDDIVFWFPTFYIPEDLVRLRKADQAALYQQWVRDGHLITTPGDFIDHSVIEQDLRDHCARFDFGRPILDQYGGAQTMVARLNADGIDAEVMAKNAKNYTDPAKDLEARVKVHRFRHTNNPVMNWMAGNVVVDRRVDGSILPKKELASSPLKIDGIDAGIMASAHRLAAQEVEEKSYLATSDEMVLL